VRQFSFGGAKVPATVRGARALLFLQGGLLVLAGVFVVAVAALLGTGNEIPFAGGTVTGGTAVALGVLYAALGLAAVYLGIELGRLTSWSRAATIALEAALIVLFMARGDFSVSSVLSVAMCVAVAVLVVTGSASAALAGARAATVPKPKPTTSSSTPPG
jgi:hypothetical protein